MAKEPVKKGKRGAGRPAAAGKILVKVHQLVKSLQGEVLHVFTVKGGLIAAMDPRG